MEFETKPIRRHFNSLGLMYFFGTLLIFGVLLVWGRVRGRKQPRLAGAGHMPTVLALPAKAHLFLLQ